MFVRFALRQRRGYSDILKLLEEIATESKMTSYKLALKKSPIYDIYFETLTHTYYIKVIFNFQSLDICLNNPYKWELGQSEFNESPKFVDGVERLIDFKPPKTRKENKKIFLIYKNSRSIMRYINECELNFIYPQDEINGCNIITYMELLAEHSLIEGR